MVLADGCFDPLHVGHLAYLKEAMSRGARGPLIVNISSDEAIRAKGREPFQVRVDRATTILALEMVDGVRLQSLPDAIRDLKPEILAKGMEWNGHLPDEVLQACQETGTRIIYTTIRLLGSTERLRA